MAERASSPLSGSPLLAQIPPSDLAGLVRAAERRGYRPGQVLFQRGDPSDGVFAVVTGDVRIYMDDDAGGEVTIATRGAGAVIGELSLIDGLPRSTNAAAATAVQALHISPDAFKSWVQAHPPAAWALLVEMSRRLREATDQVAEIALLDVETRVARRLWAEFTRFSHGKLPQAGTTMRVHQGEMATALGLTRESVNKHLAKLRTGKIIAIEAGKVTLIDPAALASRASAE